MEEILKSRNLTWDDLTPEERETAYIWDKALKEQYITVDKIRDFVRSLLYQTQLSVTKHTLTDKEDLFYKARLLDLMLIDSFLTSPQKAKEYIEMMLDTIAKKGEVG
jgi:hypothetical protein